MKLKQNNSNELLSLFTSSRKVKIVNFQVIQTFQNSETESISKTIGTQNSLP